MSSVQFIDTATEVTEGGIINKKDGLGFLK